MPKTNDLADPTTGMFASEIFEEETEEPTEFKHRRVQLLMRKSEVDFARRICRKQRLSFNELMNRLLHQWIQGYK